MNVVLLNIILIADVIGVVVIAAALLTAKLDTFSWKYRVAVSLVGCAFLWELVHWASLSQLSNSQLIFMMLKDAGITAWILSAVYDIQIKHLTLNIGRETLTDGK